MAPLLFLKKSNQNWRNDLELQGALEMFAEAVLLVSVSPVVVKIILEPWLPISFLLFQGERPWRVGKAQGSGGFVGL